MPYSQFFGILHAPARYINAPPVHHLQYDNRGLESPSYGTFESGDKEFQKTPIYAFSREGTAGDVLTYLQDFYFRIHVIPRITDLGNIGSDQEQEIKVWNGFLTPKTLLSVEGEDDGLTITGPQAPPFVWKPLLVQTWVLAVAADGPSVLTGSIVWNFSDVDAGLGLGGSRVTAWTLPEDWSMQIVERMEWLTTITTADTTGTEQRRKMRLTPRVSLTLQSIAKGMERKYVEGLIYSSGGRRFAVPFYPQAKRLQAPIAAGAMEINIDTTNLFFREGGNIILHNNNPWENEVCEIESVGATTISLVRPLLKDWPAYTRVSPARICKMVSQPDIRRLTDEAVVMRLDFQQLERETWGGSQVYPIYRNRPVIVDRPNEVEDLTYTYHRYFKHLDNRTSIPIIEDATGFPVPVQNFRWTLNGEAKQAAFRGLMYYMSGRWRSVWVPTYFNDLTPIEAITTTDLVLDIEWAYYTTQKLHQFPGRRDLCLLTRSGQHYFARVSGSEILEDGVSERLTLASAFGANIAVEEVLRISFMARMRLDQDYVEVVYDTDSEGLATANTVFRGTMDD